MGIGLVCRVSIDYTAEKVSLLLDVASSIMVVWSAPKTEWLKGSKFSPHAISIV